MTNNSNKDIFDKIMSLSILKIFNPFYRQYKEVLLYLFFGGIAFFLNIVLFALIGVYTSLNELINNIVCWIICVLFQFFTNRIWVFDGKVSDSKDFLKQMGSFFAGRVLTLVIEEVILAIFITWLHFSGIVIKLVAQIVVIVLNYIISKLIVFRKPLNY